ncbi:MAG TPA: hypothetical protein VK791_04340 [bacterium]|nr:hypothetical protein [bacterium]
MIVCRPYIQTRVFNLLIGTVMPAGCLTHLYQMISSPDYPYKAYYYVLLPVLTLAGFYFLFDRCIWAVNCDEGKKTLTFYKTFRRKSYSIRHLTEMTVFKSVIKLPLVSGFDYSFKFVKYVITFPEMDNMPELTAYLKKTNPQISIGSPEDHKYF